MRDLAQYRTPEFISDKIEFTASSMTAVRDIEGYRVFSFSTVIAEYNYGYGVWLINETYYSPTTAKHQARVRQAFSFNDYTNDTVHLYHVVRGTRWLEWELYTAGQLRRINRIVKDKVNL